MTTKSRNIKEIRKSVRSRYTDFLFTEGTIMIGLAVFIGLLSGLGAVAFIALINLIKGAAWASWGSYNGYVAGDITSILIPLIPALGGLILGPISALFPQEAKGHGVPEVMEAVVLRG